MLMKNYIFDFDGTLINSRKIMFSAFNDVANYMCFPNKIKNLSKDTEFTYPEKLISDIYKKYHLNNFSLDDCLKNYRAYLKKYENFKMTFYNVDFVLHQLQVNDKRLFIISDRRTAELEHLLNVNDIKCYFIEYLGRDIYGLKANGNSLNYLIKKYNLDPCDTLYIGDKVSDFEFAKFNQLSFAYASYSQEPFLCRDNDYYTLTKVVDVLEI
jgi:phosphoglycolate phosphatase